MPTWLQLVASGLMESVHVGHDNMHFSVIGQEVSAVVKPPRYSKIERYLTSPGCFYIFGLFVFSLFTSRNIHLYNSNSSQAGCLCRFDHTPPSATSYMHCWGVFPMDGAGVLMSRMVLVFYCHLKNVPGPLSHHDTLFVIL